MRQRRLRVRLCNTHKKYVSHLYCVTIVQFHFPAMDAEMTDTNLPKEAFDAKSSMKRTRSNRCYDNKISPPPLVNPYHLAFSRGPDIHILDPVYGTIERKLKGHTAQILSIVQLADGNLASSSRDGTVRVWDVTDGSHVTLNRNTGGFRVDQFNDGRLTFREFKTNVVVVWDFVNNTTIELRHTDRLTSWIELRDKSTKQIVTVSNATIRVWNSMTGEQVTQISSTSQIRRLFQLEDGRLVFTTQDELFVWNFVDEPVRVPTIFSTHAHRWGHPLYLHMRQLKNGQLLLYCSCSCGGIQIINIPPFSSTSSTVNNSTKEFQSWSLCEKVIELHNGKLILQLQSTVLIMDVTTKKTRQLSLRELRHMFISSDLNFIWTIQWKQRKENLRLWNLDNLRKNVLKLEIPEQWSGRRGIKELPDKRLLLMRYDEFHIFDLATKTRQTFKGSNVHIIRTPHDRQACRVNVRKALKHRLIDDVCDVVADFVSPAKRQRTM